MSKTIKPVIKKTESSYPGTSDKRSIVDFSPLESPCTSELNQRLHDAPMSVIYNCDKRILNNAKSSNFFFYGSQEPRRMSDETVLLIEDYQSYDYSNTAGRQEAQTSRGKSLKCCARRKVSEEVLTRPLQLDASDEEESHVCRICHEGDDVEPLIQPCLCKGSIGNVHASCLKVWLEQSATSRCELCNYPYAIRQTKKYSRCYSVRVFFRTVVDRRSLTYDIISFVVITPLTLVGVAMCIQASIFSSSTGEADASNQMGSITKVGMIMLSTTIAVAFSIWFYTLISYHYKSWKKWYNHCYDVEVIPVNMTSEERAEAARLLNEELQRRQISREQGLVLASLFYSSNSGIYGIYRRPSLMSPNPGFPVIQPNR